MNLEAQVLHYDKLTYTRIDEVGKNFSLNLYRRVIKNVRYIRGITLIAMYSNDKTHFFESPSVLELFRSIHKDFTKSFGQFHPMFIQGIASFLSKSYTSPNQAIGLIDKFFKTDLLYFNFFAFSTFPAIFQHFISAEFLNFGSQFLILFFQQSQNITLCSSLISSFFSCETVFYHYLWSSLSHRFASIPEHSLTTPKFSQFYEILIFSIKEALPHLSQCHIDVLRSFSVCFPDSYLQTFGEKIILERFQSAANGNHLLSSPEINKLFSNFLHQLLETKQYIHCLRDLFSIFLAQMEFIETRPNLLRVHWPRGCPLIFCERDFYLLFQILQDGSILSAQAKAQKFGSKMPFDPMEFNVYPMIHTINIRAEGEKLVQTLFGGHPTKFSFNSIGDDEKIRLWNRIKSDKNGRQILKYLFELEPSDWKTFCFQSHLNFQCDSLDLIGSTICISEMTSILKNSYYSIRIGLQSEAHQCFQPNITTLTGIEASLIWIPDLSQGISKIPNWLSFEATCAGLDTMNILLTSKGILCNQQFNAFFNDWKQNFDFKNNLMKIKMQLKKISVLLTHLDDSEWGKRLKRFIEIFKNLKIISKISQIKLEILLKYVIIKGSCNSFLTTFLFLHHFVYGSSTLIVAWNYKILEIWSNLAQQIWDLLRNHRLYDICTNPVDCFPLYSQTII